MRTRIFFVAVAVLFVATATGERSNEIKSIRSDRISHYKVLSKVSVPQQINYQGYLTNVWGNPVTDTLEMSFSIWNDSIFGDSLWTETQPSIIVLDGLFNVLLGSVNPIPESAFSGTACWLETQIGTEILSPRKTIVSVGYVFRAATADVATHADYADSAGMTESAEYAESAGYADSAVVSGYTQHATHADTSTYALHAKYADSAGVKFTVLVADSAQVAAYAHEAGHTANSDFADSARVAGPVVYADSAGVVSYAHDAAHANTSDYATYADSAGVTGLVAYADSAGGAQRIGGIDVVGLDVRYVNEGQANSVTSGMIVDGTIQQADLSFTPGDITAVIAGDGLDGGGTSNDVTLSVDVTDFAGDGLGVATTKAGDLKVNTGTGLTIASDAVKLASNYESGSAYDARFVNEDQSNSITSAMITNGEIVNADISGSAAIAPNKISGTAWTSNNDGPGSGLNADMVDGQHASDFLSTSNDYGRSGVSSALYEGTTALSDKYLGISDKAADADKLDNHDSNYFATAIHNHDTDYINDGAGEINSQSDFNFASATFITNLDADKVDGQNYNSNWPTTLPNIQSACANDFHNIGGTDATDDLVSGAELDGVFSTTGLLKRTGAATYTVITDNSSNWNTAYGWGDHATAGYLSTANDWGRSGVSLTLYEGTTALSDKYLGISAKAADADKLDNHDSDYFATATHDHDADYINDGAGEINSQSDFNFISSTFIANLDADKVDGQNYNSNWPTILTNIQNACANDFHNIGGTDATDDNVSGSELDGVFSTTGLLKRTGAATYTTITDNSSDWNTAYGWGNHATVGYLSSLSGHNVTELDDVTSAGSGVIITSAERTKLDGIEAGATADQTPAEILTAIKTVDGSGSGLDADLLDGLNSSNFVQTSGDQTINGVKTFGSIPILPASNPIQDNQASRKAYVDAQDVTKISIPGSSARGDILYYDGSIWTRLPAGTSGQFLKTQGAGADPIWSAVTAAPEDGSVSRTKLKTTTSEVSTDNNTTGANLILGGGEYGFYPQVKGTELKHVRIFEREAGNGPGSYATNIWIESASTTVYAQQRYVTASGKDHWIFLLINRLTKDIIAAYSAPDHPCYGNGGDPDKVPHPFSSYDESKHEIAILDNETVSLLKQESLATGKSILTLVNEEYKPDMSHTEVYEPLHSGLFLGEEPVMIETIPDYIKVRKLVRLTPEDKQQRALRHLAAERLRQQKELELQTKLLALKQKLNLTDEEFVLLTGKEINYGLFAAQNESSTDIRIQAMNP